MRPVQETFIELLRQGMTPHAAIRRIGMAASMPYHWRKHDAEFRAAWDEVAQTTPRFNIRVQHDWVNELIGDLAFHGLVATDKRTREELENCLATFFRNKGALKYGTMRQVYNSKQGTDDEQRRVVDGYIKLKASGALPAQLHAYIVEHGVTKNQIGRWCRKHRGPDALKVGPHQPGYTRDCILRTIRSSDCPLSLTNLSVQLNINRNTVRNHVYVLHSEGLIKQSWYGHEARYA